MSAEGTKRGECSSQVNCLPLPCGRTGSLGVGFKVYQDSGREDVEPKKCPANLWALDVDEEMNKSHHAIGWVLEVYPSPLPKHIPCSVLVIMSPGGPRRKIRLNSYSLG